MNQEKFDYIAGISKDMSVFYHLGKDVSDFIGCLFALESNFGKSRLAIDYNNHCSMKVPFVRISVASNFAESSDIWSKYPSFSSCELDFVLWLQFQKPLRKQLDSVDLFIPLLRSYCPERDYITKIQSIYKQFKSYKNV